MIAVTSTPWPAGWIAPALGHGVRAIMTTRVGPSASRPSRAPFDDFNLGDHVGDAPADVLSHRRELANALKSPPAWLRQVHGHHLQRLGHGDRAVQPDADADGSFTTEPGVVCAILVADCLPILLAAPERRGVAALHAGWRGLAGAGDDMGGRGIADTGVAALCEATSCDPADLQAWLGPCIGPTAFQVGHDVLAGFGVDPTDAHPRFNRQSADRWLADLAGLAADRLRALGLGRIGGGSWCTATDASRFFSFRRDGVTGRQAACIWIDPHG